MPSSVVLDEKRNFVSVGGEYRVRDIYVGEEPLDVNRTYTLASHNYWLKSCGDGMSMLMGCPILKDETMVDVDTITSYISEYLGGTVGEEYKDPTGQGRITIKYHRKEKRSHSGSRPYWDSEGIILCGF